jgi:hypothetical protein
MMNHKKLHRLYREEGLQVRLSRPRERLRATISRSMPLRTASICPALVVSCRAVTTKVTWPAVRPTGGVVVPSFMKQRRCWSEKATHRCRQSCPVSKSNAVLQS